MDLGAIYSFLSQSYWAKGIPKSTVKKAMENALCFGVFDSADVQVGFARAVTDAATLDAHGLHEQYRFKALANPEIFMEAWNPNVYDA